MPSMRLPLSEISPAVGTIIPETARIVVVLPAPLEADQRHDLALGPSIEMPCRTCTLP